MDSACHVSTPIIVNNFSVISSSPTMSDPQSIVGDLKYITITWPNIVFAINHICQFMHALIEQNLKDIKKILHYLKDTILHDLLLYYQSS